MQGTTQRRSRNVDSTGRLSAAVESNDTSPMRPVCSPGQWWPSFRDFSGHLPVLLTKKRKNAGEKAKLQLSRALMISSIFIPFSVHNLFVLLRDLCFHYRYRGRLLSSPRSLFEGSEPDDPFRVPSAPSDPPSPEPLPSLLSRELLLLLLLSESRSRSLRNLLLRLSLSLSLSPRSRPLSRSPLSLSNDEYSLEPKRGGLGSSGMWLMSWMNRHGSFVHI